MAERGLDCVKTLRKQGSNIHDYVKKFTKEFGKGEFEVAIGLPPSQAKACVHNPRVMSFWWIVTD